MAALISRWQPSERHAVKCTLNPAVPGSSFQASVSWDASPRSEFPRLLLSPGTSLMPVRTVQAPWMFVVCWLLFLILSLHLWLHPYYNSTKLLIFPFHRKKGGSTGGLLTYTAAASRNDVQTQAFSLPAGLLWYTMTQFLVNKIKTLWNIY